MAFCTNAASRARASCCGRLCWERDCYLVTGSLRRPISVLSAVEGLQVATPALGNTVVPITVALLTALFAIQFRGTSRIGIIFGPILIIWFVVIAGLGIWQIGQHPEVL